MSSLAALDHRFPFGRRCWSWALRPGWLVLLGALAASGCEVNQSVKERDRGDVVVSWPEVSDPEFKVLREVLQLSGRVQEAADILNATLALPRDLTLEFTSCGHANAFYRTSETTVYICYELVEVTRRTLREYTTSPEEIEDLAIGTWYFIMFHEIGHALYHLYDLPDIGNQEDHADELSTITLIRAAASERAAAAALFWAALDDGMYTVFEFADEHSLSQRRFFNILCLVHGSDPEYWELDEVFPSRDCVAEYERKLEGWGRVLEPWLLVPWTG